MTNRLNSNSYLSLCHLLLGCLVGYNMMACSSTKGTSSVSAPTNASCYVNGVTLIDATLISKCCDKSGMPLKELPSVCPPSTQPIVDDVGNGVGNASNPGNNNGNTNGTLQGPVPIVDATGGLGAPSAGGTISAATAGGTTGGGGFSNPTAGYDLQPLSTGGGSGGDGSTGSAGDDSLYGSGYGDYGGGYGGGDGGGGGMMAGGMAGLPMSGGSGYGSQGGYPGEVLGHLAPNNDNSTAGVNAHYTGGGGSGGAGYASKFGDGGFGSGGFGSGTGAGSMDFGMNGKGGKSSRGLASGVNPMASADPADYFSLLRISDNIFEEVTHCYTSQQRRWALNKK